MDRIILHDTSTHTLSTFGGLVKVVMIVRFVVILVDVHRQTIGTCRRV